MKSQQTRCLLGRAASMASGVVVLLGGLVNPACTAASSDCAVGSEGCACTEGGSCDKGLICAPSSQICQLGPGGSSGGSSGTSTSEGGLGGSTETSSSTASGGSGAEGSSETSGAESSSETSSSSSATTGTSTSRYACVTTLTLYTDIAHTLIYSIEQYCDELQGTCEDGSGNYTEFTKSRYDAKTCADLGYSEHCSDDLFWYRPGEQPDCDTGGGCEYSDCIAKGNTPAYCDRCLN